MVDGAIEHRIIGEPLFSVPHSPILGVFLTMTKNILSIDMQQAIRQ